MANITVTYLVNGETYATRETAAGTAPVLPDPPEVEGFDFAGWEGLPDLAPTEA